MLNIRRSIRSSQDRGAVLLLTLVLTVVLAMVVVAIATYTSTALRSSKVTTQVVHQLASAESALEFGLGRADVGNCPALTNNGLINGAMVSTTCTRVVRVENADGLFGLVVTGMGVTSRPALVIRGSNSDANGLKKIRGPIYLGEPMTVDLTAAQAVVHDPVTNTDVGGDVRFDVAGDCLPTSTSPAPPSVWAAPVPVVSCDSRGWQAVASAPDLSSDPLRIHADLNRATLFSGAAIVPPIANASGCTEYSPGWFDGSLLSGNTLNLNSPSFFHSGVYYFKDVVIDISHQVAVGKRTDLAEPATPTAPDDFPIACATEWASETDPGTGAVWILGGSSRIQATQANLDFYPRQIARLNNTFGPANTTVIAFDSTNPYGYAATTLNANAADNEHAQKLLNRDNGSQADISFYGLIYAPASWIDTGNAAPGAFVQFIGGLVIGRAIIQTAANVYGFAISVPTPTPVVNYYLVESTATADGNSTTVRAVSKQGATGLEVITWRVV